MKKIFAILTLFATITCFAGDFKYKGFHIDLRNEVMTVGALKDFAKQLSNYGVNTILMEYEATFPFDKHAVISCKKAYSRDEIKNFVKYCSSLGIEVIPMQQNFGHVEYIIKHDRYNDLAENKKNVSQVCPLKTDGCIELFDDLFTDMMSLHPSNFFHIGGDETYLLGQCKDCSAKAAKNGKSKLFVDYIKLMCDLVIKHGKTPIMWADIILKYPEAIDELPKETIFVDWNYGWDVNHFGNVEALISKGAKFWGAPAIRSHPDDIYVTTWSKHFENQRDFIPYCRQLGYQGIIMTSWSTSGLYSTIWEQNNEVMELIPQRNVYPMSGFDILLHTYKIAINQAQPIDIHNVIINYGLNELGLSINQSEQLYDIYMIVQSAWRGIKPTLNITNSEIIKQCDHAISMLNLMKVQNGKKDLQHLALMFAIRKNHAQFKELEAIYQSEDFNLSDAQQLRDKLAPIVEQCKFIDVQFYELNHGYITDSDISDINTARVLKMQNTLDRLNALVK